MGDDEGKQPEDNTWVHEALVKEAQFDLEHAQETFMEDKKSFANSFTLGRKDRLEPEMEPSMLMMFLEACMKLLHDSKAIKGLQELINRCTRTAPGEPRVVWKIGKHKKRMEREIVLTPHIGEYKMDQVILDLGLDGNVLLRQTWERMGRPMLQWSPIQL